MFIVIYLYWQIVYQFPDIQRAVAISIRRGVADSVEVPFFDSFEGHTRDGAEVVATVTSTTFVEIAAMLRNKTGAVMSGDMKVEGKGALSSIALKKFMDNFDDSATPFQAPL
jgi:hypothetical protein